jgi:NAD+ diphosphatase
MESTTSAPVLPYAGVPLDRDAEARGDDALLERLAAASGALAVVLSEDRCFVLHGGERARIPLSELRDLASRIPGRIYLGRDANGPVFALDVPAGDERGLAALRERGEFVDLREAVRRLPHAEAALLGYARALAHWNRNYRFCSRCGSPTESARGGHTRRCTSATDCGREHFPHINPAVIMLVTDATHPDGLERCLLARHAGRISAVFATLAGFVEPGETLEEAVAREVLEEVGLTVSDITYRGSQPWPFPAQLMLGFRAVARSRELAHDPAEIEEARWFTRDEVRRAGEWGDESAATWIPRSDSISRYLIDTWLAEGS